LKNIITNPQESVVDPKLKERTNQEMTEKENQTDVSVNIFT